MKEKLNGTDIYTSTRSSVKKTEYHYTGGGKKKPNTFIQGQVKTEYFYTGGGKKMKYLYTGGGKKQNTIIQGR